MKNKLVILVFILLVSTTANSQKMNTCTATFEKAILEPCFGNLINMIIAKEYSFLRNIPDIPCDLSTVGYFRIDRNVYKDSIQNEMHLFVGVNESKKEKYIIVDTNNDLDFSDDRLYTFALPDKTLTREEKLGKCIGLQITQGSDTANIGIDPYNFFGMKSSLDPDERLKVVIPFRDYMKAQIQLGDTPVEIQSTDGFYLFPRNINERKYFEFIYNNKDGKRVSKTITKKDTINIEGNLFVINKIQHPDIVLSQVGTLADSSRVGVSFPVVYAKDIDAINNLRINDLTENKYVFIDFWGSWCGPCLMSIPKLKEFYEKIKKRDDVLMLGIAAEDKKDIEKLKSIIAKEQIEWTNLVVLKEERKEISSIINKLNIMAYPTYLIIDNRGRIVYTERSVLKTQEAIDLFIKLIGE